MLARKVQESEIWKKPSDWLKIFIFILQSVNHANGKQFPRGSNFFNSREMAIECHVSKDSVHNFLKWAKSTTLITTRKTTRGAVISVVNYDKYQALDNYKSHTENHTNNQTGTIQEPYRSHTINKNDKNDKNDKNTHVAKATVREIPEEAKCQALLLVASLQQNNTAFSQKFPVGKDFPALYNWSKDFEMLRRIDKATDTQIEFVLRWLSHGTSESSAFWRKNILSSHTFRRQWQKLVAAVKYDYEKSNRKSDRVGVVTF